MEAGQLIQYSDQLLPKRLRNHNAMHSRGKIFSLFHGIQSSSGPTQTLTTGMGGGGCSGDKVARA
jgi:hypothetical protein